jgi:ribosomal protein S18 acetylase RimI-like enzyme
VELPAKKVASKGANTMMGTAESTRDDTAGSDVRIEIYTGSRADLRPLFEMAEDSQTQLSSYIEAGRVLVAVAQGQVIGHLQLVETDDPSRVEIKNMAVDEARQGRGVGRLLIQAASRLLAAEQVKTLLVATAAADVGNLRFYQRQGFRLRSVERDAFTSATGYPHGLRIDGIELRDRVWLDRRVRRAAEEGRTRRAACPVRTCATAFTSAPTSRTR